MATTETVQKHTFFEASTDHPARPSLYVLIFTLCCFLGLLIRVYWLGMSEHAIGNEGAEYAQIAENLLHGQGYLGTQIGDQIVFPPLYPLLISLFFSVIGNSEVAGRLVSFVMGIMLFIPLFLIINKIYDGFVGIVGVALAVVHPYLVEISMAVLSESTYLVMMAWGIYAGLLAVERPEKRFLAFAGAVWGLAYLTRPEGLMGIVVLSAIIVWQLINHARMEHLPFSFRNRVADSRRIGGLLLCLVGPFLLLVTPYVLFLYSVTGQLRLENKTSIIYTISERMLTGMSYQQAALEIDEELHQVGPELNNTAFVVNVGYKPSISKLVTLFHNNFYKNLKRIFDLLVMHATPPIILLVPLGIFGRIWGRKRFLSEVYLLGLGAVILVPLLSISFTHERYVTALMPLLLIWAAMGTVELAQWFSKTIIKFGPVRRSKIVSARAMVLVTVALTILIAALFVHETRTMVAQSAIDNPGTAQRMAGRWLEVTMPGAKQIMSVDTSAAYYSGGTWLPVPYATEPTRLAYIAQVAPDFIVLHGSLIEQTRPDIYLWWLQGIPDDRAELVNRFDDILIYRWHSED